MAIEFSVDELLGERGHSFYWLAKETGLSHTTLWRLKKGKALGICHRPHLLAVRRSQFAEVVAHRGQRQGVGEVAAVRGGRAPEVAPKLCALPVAHSER